MRKFRVAVCTFLFVVSIAVVSGRDLRPIHADETTVVDPNHLAFAIENVDNQSVGASIDRSA